LRALNQREVENILTPNTAALISCGRKHKALVAYESDERAALARLAGEAATKRHPFALVPPAHGLFAR
jgi:hypothetical protein